MSTRSRAERFEDEKKRIIETCFGKKDEDEFLLESYITHIRITEDGAYPSSPPPPDSLPSNKKPRLIIVAVRKSGRVRMHKARENGNGTFSIGKTWVLDDLTAIQTFVGAPAKSAEDEQQRQWAGGMGFVVTIIKPYYWQAATAKEKDFFIASLVKIFKKYTGDKVPELIGFDPAESEQLLSGGPYRSISSDSRGLSITDSSRQDSVSSTAIPPIPVPPSDAGSKRPTEAKGKRPSEAHPRWTPEPHAAPSLDPGGGALQGDGIQFAKQIFGVESHGDNQRPGSVPPHLGSDPFRKDSRASPHSLDKKHRLAPQPSSDHFASGTDDSVPPSRNESPIPTSMPRQEDAKRSEKRSMEEPRSSAPRTYKAPIVPIAALDSISRNPSPHTVPSPIGSSRNPSPHTFPSEKSSHIADRAGDEAYRPGLGPMVKQKSKRDLAGTFRKAALAYSAFKPRNGSDAKSESNAPDGISAVVPAPLRGVSQDSIAKSDIVDRKSRDRPAVITSKENISTEPTNMTAALDAEASPIPGLPFTSPTNQSGSKEPRIISAGPKSPKRQLTQRMKTAPGETARHVSALGIDPRVVRGSTVDIEAVLKEFGCWTGDGTRSKSPNTLDTELRRELGRVEAGSLIGQSDGRDERVKAVEELLDEAIAECEELEGLLTLYSVELSTLNDDVAFIESQSQGLQIQTSNQRLLQTELQNRLQTPPIPSR